MVCDIALPPQEKTNLKASQVVHSYDSGFEHCAEHLLSVRQLVEDADAEPLEGQLETTLRGIATV